MQRVFHSQKLQRLFLLELEEWDTGHLRHDVCDILLRNDRLAFFLVLLPFDLGVFEQLSQPLFLLAELHRLFEILERDRQLLFADDLLELLDHRAQIAGQCKGLKFGA